MPINKIITVYPFGELSEKAKRKAMSDYLAHWGYDNARWAMEWIECELDEVGLKLTEWDAYCGTATVAPNDTTPRVILRDIVAHEGGHVLDEYKADCAALLAKMDRLDRVDGLYYATKRRDSQTINKALGELLFNLEGEIEDETTDLWKSMGRTLGHIIKKEVEYTETEEYLAETFDANECLFFEEGGIAPRDLVDAASMPAPESITG